MARLSEEELVALMEEAVSRFEAATAAYVDGESMPRGMTPILVELGLHKMTFYRRLKREPELFERYHAVQATIDQLILDRGDRLAICTSSESRENGDDSRDLNAVANYLKLRASSAHRYNRDTPIAELTLDTRHEVRELEAGASLRPILDVFARIEARMLPAAPATLKELDAKPVMAIDLDTGKVLKAELEV